MKDIINIDTIRERDMDIVIMREFYSNKGFADLFLKQIGIESYNIISIEHSVMDAALGESDIEITLDCGGEKTTLLIENKINADEQPKQYERYVERGEKKKSDGAIDNYFVFMTAPHNYFYSHNQYPKRVAYEEMLSVMTDVFSISAIKKALEKKEAYTPTPDEAVTTFWKALYKYVDIYCHSLYMLMPTKTGREKGTKAQWPGFRTGVSGMEIQWKADRGAVDLQLNGMACHKSQIAELLHETIGEHKYSVEETGKSASIRKQVADVDFHKPFAEQSGRVREALDAISEMQGLACMIKDGIQQIRDNEQSPMLQQAIAIATEAHKGQRDKAGADYINHPLRVATRLLDEKEKIVAVLHDTIEDTYVTADYLCEQGFPQDIVDGVLAVTRKDDESYDNFVRRAARNPLGLAVKMADLEDNMDIRRLNYPLNEWDFERLNKYLKAYKYLKGVAGKK